MCLRCKVLTYNSSSLILFLQNVLINLNEILPLYSGNTFVIRFPGISSTETYFSSLWPGVTSFCKALV